MSRLLALLLGLAGIAVALAGWSALAAALPVPPNATSMAMRVGVAAACLLPAAGVLLAMTLVQSAARYLTGVFDPLAGRDGRFLLLNQRVIGNTLEQMAVFVPALLALAAGTDGRAMPQVMALALVFAVARLAFWVGYLTSPLLRGPGMAATFAASAAALVWAGAAWLR